jgi:enoyl-CoA hydratase/carnithine racemase
MSYPTKLLFNKDGVSLSATLLTDSDSPTSNNTIVTDDDEDIEHNGLILTLYLHRHTEKNAINPTIIQLMIQALDVVDSHPLVVNTNNKSLIVTALDDDADGKSGGKFFCNGLDLEWMLRANNNNSSTSNETNNSDDNGGNNATSSPAIDNSPTSKMIQDFNSLILARILTLPFRTIAAINGHCIGAGLFLALACDYRLMRTERGYIQWPEARLGMRMTKGFAELSKAKIDTHRVLREGLLTAKKYTSSEALEGGIIDAQYPIGELYREAFRWAMDGLPESGLSLEYFDPKTYTEMKIEMYTDAYRALRFGSVENLPYSRI